MQNTFKPAGQAVADLVAGIKEPEPTCSECGGPPINAWFDDVCNECGEVSEDGDPL